jgi:hypothetical protein
LVTTGGGSTSRIIGYVGKCVGVPNSIGVDGQYLNLWECNGTAAQAWTFPGDGTIRASGKCMAVAWGSRDNGVVRDGPCPCGTAGAHGQQRHPPTQRRGPVTVSGGKHLRIRGSLSSADDGVDGLRLAGCIRG